MNIFKKLAQLRRRKQDDNTSAEGKYQDLLSRAVKEKLRRTDTTEHIAHVLNQATKTIEDFEADIAKSQELLRLRAEFKDLDKLSIASNNAAQERAEAGRRHKREIEEMKQRHKAELLEAITKSSQAQGLYSAAREAQRRYEELSPKSSGNVFEQLTTEENERKALREAQERSRLTMLESRARNAYLSEDQLEALEKTEPDFVAACREVMRERAGEKNRVIEPRTVSLSSQPGVPVKSVSPW